MENRKCLICKQFLYGAEICSCVSFAPVERNSGNYESPREVKGVPVVLGGTLVRPLPPPSFDNWKALHKPGSKGKFLSSSEEAVVEKYETILKLPGRAEIKYALERSYVRRFVDIDATSSEVSEEVTSSSMSMEDSTGDVLPIVAYEKTQEKVQPLLKGKRYEIRELHQEVSQDQQSIEVEEVYDMQRDESGHKEDMFQKEEKRSLQENEQELLLVDKKKEIVIEKTDVNTFPKTNNDNNSVKELHENADERVFGLTQGFLYPLVTRLGVEYNKMVGYAPGFVNMVKNCEADPKYPEIPVPTGSDILREYSRRFEFDNAGKSRMISAKRYRVIDHLRDMNRLPFYGLYRNSKEYPVTEELEVDCYYNIVLPTMRVYRFELWAGDEDLTQDLEFGYGYRRDLCVIIQFRVPKKLVGKTQVRLRVFVGLVDFQDFLMTSYPFEVIVKRSQLQKKSRRDARLLQENAKKRRRKKVVSKMNEMQDQMELGFQNLKGDIRIGDFEDG
jgi:hypothetical protein